MKKLFSVAALTLCAAADVQAGVIFFPNDFAGFTAAMTADGNTLLGTETFEESTLPPASSVGMDDPLTQGVPNGPYPAGLLEPMTVQSNLSGFAAVAPNPRGSDGLVALSAGSFGSTSDVVVANFFSDSLDWIFSAATQLAGLGFNTLNFRFAATLEIEVYDTANVLLGATTIGGDPGGTNFLGIEATGGDLIGRVNIFSTGSTGSNFEGGDNAMLFQAGAQQVPEPGTLLLVVVAGASMGLLRRYRRPSIRGTAARERVS